MHFIGYTYKADVENEKSTLVNVLKDLDGVGEGHSGAHDHHKTKNEKALKHNPNINNQGGNSHREISRNSSENHMA